MLSSSTNLRRDGIDGQKRWRRSRCAHAIAAAAILFCAVHEAHAQSTLAWANPGTNPNIENPANWGGTAPNFSTDPSTSDSAIFSASTNTTVQLRDMTTGDPFANVTFDENAPAYTFNLPPGNTTNELVILQGGTIANNSAVTQNLTGIAALTLKGAAAGFPGTLAATNGDPTTKLAFDVSQIKFDNPGSTGNFGYENTAVINVAAGFDVRTNTINGVQNGDTPSSLYVRGDEGLGTGGILHITGDSGSNSGRLFLDTGGNVRISHPSALGDPARNTTLLGGFRNGRLELTGNITVNENFALSGRQGDIGIFGPAIVNVDGTNTVTGTFTFGGGGNAYNFASESGTLIVQSDLNMTASAERYFTFQKAGNIIVNGNISSSASGGDVTIVKYDSGTTTLNGSNNNQVGHFSIRGGTLAIGPNAGFTFAPFATDYHYPDPPGIAPRVIIDAGTTLDVSAKAGGFNLTQFLQGNGTVKGTLNMANGTQVLPGAIATYDGQGMSVNDFFDFVGTLTFEGASSGGGGDYNDDGEVDAADYVVWRKNPAGFGGPAGYSAWRTNFGSSAGGAGGLNLSAGSSVIWQLGAFSTTTPGTDFDQIVINNGDLTLGGTSNLTLDFGLVSDPNGGDPFWNSAHSWKVIDTTGNTGNTNFASITNGTFTPGHFTTTVGTGADAGDIFLNYVLGGSGASLTTGAVPEPAALMLLALGALGLLSVRKR
jgi:hypothetical protein